MLHILTLLHSEWPKLYGVLTVLSAIECRTINSLQKFTTISILLIVLPRTQRGTQTSLFRRPRVKFGAVGPSILSKRHTGFVMSDLCLHYLLLFFSLMH